MSRRDCNTEISEISSYEPARDAIESGRRWIEKANENTSDELNSQIDKFFSLYVSYNIIYSLISHEDNWDRCSAVSVISSYMRNKGIQTFTQNRTNISNMIEPIREHNIFHIYNEDRDFRLIANIDNRNNLEESVLDILYGIRCNMFHGAKKLITEQSLLLVPANLILEALVNDLITSITCNWQE